jgi:UDPglucose--hexose-1-phosphate uridylyltransferase
VRGVTQGRPGRTISVVESFRKAAYRRPDGRALIYYAWDRPLPLAPADGLAMEPGRMELRWNALLGEWVIVATHRQGRTFFPPEEYCPLCPTTRPDAPTEVPAPDFEVAVFENRFPSLRPDAPAPEPSQRGSLAAATGVNEVIVYSPDHAAGLPELPEVWTRRLVGVWADRYAELGSLDGVRYVFIFENRGKEIGVTLTHPHGQIYAFPYVPPRILQERAAFEAYAAAHGGRCLLCDAVEREMRDGRRVVIEGSAFAAFVPFAARWPYEAHIVARAHRRSLLDLAPGERDDLAHVYRELLRAYDALWGFPMPYVMSMHQAAADGSESLADHLHIEFTPPYRARERLKYLAGCETGAGTFINDTLPEETAAELRAARSRS